MKTKLSKKTPRPLTMWAVQSITPRTSWLNGWTVADRRDGAWARYTADAQGKFLAELEERKRTGAVKLVRVTVALVRETGGEGAGGGVS